MKKIAMKSNAWASAYSLPSDFVDKKRGIIRPCYCPPKVRPPSGVGDGLKIGPVPRNLAGANQTFALVRPLARYMLPGDGVGTTASTVIQCKIYNPSDRLRVKIVVYFESETGSNNTDPSFSNTPTWKVWAMSRNPETNKEALLQQAYPTSGTKNLPDAYEVDTAAQLLRADVTLDDDNFSASYIPTTQRANCILICTWEQNVPIEEKELTRLYSQCSVSVPASPVLIVNNAV